MKKNLLFATAIICTPLFFPSGIFAQENALTAIIFSQYQRPVYGEAFMEPYSPDNIPIQKQQAVYNSQKDRYLLTFPSLPDNNYYILIFQPMANSDTYTKDTDPAALRDNNGSGYSSNSSLERSITLITPRLDNITYLLNSDGKTATLTIQNTSKSINFKNYPQKLLNAEILNNDYSQNVSISLDPACSSYYCGNISATISNLPEKNFDISINDGPQSLIYIKNALTIIRPKDTIPLSTNSIARKQAIPSIKISTPKPTQTPPSTTPSPVKPSHDKNNPNKNNPKRTNIPVNIFNLIITFIKNALKRFL